MSDTTDHDMSCDSFADELADYLEGELSDSGREAMEQHAASCPSCGALLADLSALPAHASALPLLVPEHDLWSGIAQRIDARAMPLHARPVQPRRQWQRHALAAAALILVTAGVTHLVTRAALTPAPVVTAAAIREPAAHAALLRPDSISLAEPARSEPTRMASVSPAASAREEAAPRSHAAAPDRRDATVRFASDTPLLHDAEPVYDREIGALRAIVKQRRSQLDPATVAVLEQSVAIIDSAIAQSRAALARDPASGFLASQLSHSLGQKVELLRTAASLPARL